MISRLSYKRLIILLAGMFLSSASKAQVWEFGGHVGYNISKFRVDQNKLSDAIFIRSGKPFSAYNFGVQMSFSPARHQSSAYFRLVPSVLWEATLCRCGGFMDLSITSPNGSRSFNELEYTIYRGEYGVKFVLSSGPLQLILGPTVSNRFYTAVQFGASEGQKFAGDQFKVMALAYEVGAGLNFNTIHVSARFQRFINGYGRESDLIPVVYKHHQVRFLLHYYFLRRERGKNWNSIYWD
tara:strand:- start:2466 stop:3182 length:717 start_codon:yes stop_codon:yes gene_type:complete